jgi:hypothetical protein
MNSGKMRQTGNTQEKQQKPWPGEREQQAWKGASTGQKCRDRQKEGEL